ncbi:MAG: hypothetical protein NWE89_03615 [Candidatus Bathyarchaeota archaeon]|nr:hypothetical protein [Candidatus Bathyarchaeota archaeon]
MSDREKILALMLIAFAVLSLPIGLTLIVILGYSTLVDVLRFIDCGAYSDAINATVSSILLLVVSAGVQTVVKWLRK